MQQQRGFSSFNSLLGLSFSLNQVEQIFSKIKNSVVLTVVRETEDELVFQYNGIGIIMHADDLMTQKGTIKSLFVDAEVCSTETPQVFSAMVGMLRANYFMTRHAEIPMFFSLRDNVDGSDSAFCLAMRMHIDQAAEFDWSDFFDQLHVDIHKFRNTVRK